MRTFLQWVDERNKIQEGLLDKMRRTWDKMAHPGTHKIRKIGGKWYITLGHDKPEGELEWDAIDYGPFNSEEEAEAKLSKAA
jgi:hypothetical protein